MGDLDTSRWARARRLARLGAGAAWQQGKALVGADARAVHTRIAEMMTAEFGGMKGLPMKVGQILSYMDGVVPDDVRDVYQRALAPLRTQSRPMGADEVARVVQEALGAPPDAIFDAWDPTPVASASIGQVHRARFGGREVAVKVQIPGIAEATAADLRNLDPILGLMRTVMPGMDVRALVQDFADRLAEECDYRHEAAMQTRFGAIWAGDADLVVPEVVAEVSTDTVLTTAWIDGVDLEPFAAEASQAERDRAGLTLFRAAFGTLLRHGLAHADPHPGNLRFRVGPDRRLGLLDFGCVQEVDDDARRDLVRLLRAAVDGAPLGPLAADALGLDADPVTAAVVADLTTRVLDPILAPQPYRFTRAFSASLAREVVDAKARLATRFVTRQAHVRAERNGVMLLVRNLFGLATIWGILETQGDVRAVTADLLPA